MQQRIKPRARRELPWGLHPCAPVEALEGRRLLSGSPPELVPVEDQLIPASSVNAMLGRADGDPQTAAAAATVEAAVFAHPGILNTEADFDRMRQKVNAGAEPWLSGWNKLRSHGWTHLGMKPGPVETIVRGDTNNSYIIWSQAAQMTNLALIWKVTGDTRYADLAVQFLNAWSSVHKNVHGNSNVALALGLYGFQMANVAEIMRTYSGWAEADQTQFKNYLLDVWVDGIHNYLGLPPYTQHWGGDPSHYWANWDLANIGALMAIGVFTDRQDLYDEALNYVYNGVGNGAFDKAIYYLHAGNLGQGQEAGRDQGHATLDFALLGQICQMAWNQGDDLFSYKNNVVLAGVEHLAKYNLFNDVPYVTYQSRTSGGPQTQIAGHQGFFRPSFELFYNHYVNVKGLSAPYTTQAVMERTRPEGDYGNGDHYSWGTLLFALDPNTAVYPPQNLVGYQKGTGNIELSWWGGANTTSFNVYRATNAAGPFTQIASGILPTYTSYTDTNLPAGTYYYKVTGVSGLGETAATNVLQATSGTPLISQLNFNESTGTTASDSVGSLTGTLNGGATWAPGKSGNAVSLDGVNDYVSLPSGAIKDVADFTISTWVYLNASQTWARIFDFGDTRGDWMFLTPRNGAGNMEFATGTTYNWNKQTVSAPALATNQWVHVAVTFTKRLATVYVNGVAVGSNANMDFPPHQINGGMPNSWLGRSQYTADPYLNGKIDDFRIYNGAMNPGAIYTLATGNQPPAPPATAPASLTATAVPGNTINLSWPAVAGATKYTVRRATTSGGPYTTVATLLTGTTFADTGRTAGVTYYYVVFGYNNGGDGPNSPQASAVALPPMPATPTNLAANAISSSAIGLTWSASANAATYSVKRALASGGPFTTIASGLTATSYTDTGRTAGTTYYYVVTAVNASGESGNSNVDSATPSDLIAHLKFDQSSGTTATDSGSNGWNGTLVNGALWAPGRLGNAVDLDGVDDHVTLPAGVLNGVTNFTIATWVYQDAAANWTRVFDFGTGTTRNMFLTPQNGANGRVRFAITTGGGGGEQQITGAAALPVGTWTHVAVTLSGTLGILYVNGVEVGRNSAMTLNPAALGSTNLNYIGRSQYADPYLNGRVDDLRIYARGLAPGEVSTLAGGNAPAAPAGLNAIPDDGQVFLSWPAVPGATSYTVKRATVSGGPYTTIASDLTSTSRTDASVINSFTYYYVVTASNILGEGAASPQAAATPMPTFTGTTEDDQWVVRRSGSSLQIWIGDGTGDPSYQVNFASVNALTFAGGGGNDTVTVDGSGGAAVPAGGITFDRGDGHNTLVLRNVNTAPVHLAGGANGSNTVVVDGGTFAFASDLNGASLQATNGANVTLDSGQHLAGLAIDNDATVTIASGGALALIVDALTIANGTLDLTDNAMVVNGGALATVQAALKSAFADWAWTGAGITSSVVRNDVAGGVPSALGVLLNGDGAGNPLFYGDGTGLPRFAGRSVSANAVLLKYTRLGDGDLNGVVDTVDFALFQAGYTGAAPYIGFAFGDYDYNGVVDTVDFGLFQAGYQYVAV